MAKVTSTRKPAVKAASKRFPPLKLKAPSKTIEQFAREQGVKPIRTIEELSALGALFPEKDLDAFAAFIADIRRKERSAPRKKGR
jgi:hypothetical protein